MGGRGEGGKVSASSAQNRLARRLAVTELTLPEQGGGEGERTAEDQ